jgi:Mannosyltransferase (PIG-V)
MLFRKHRAKPYLVTDMVEPSSTVAWQPHLLLTGADALAHRLGQLAVWDSVFFVRIAQCGYEYEQFHAFFPLLPTVLRLLSFNGGHVWLAWCISLFCRHLRLQFMALQPEL